VGRLGKAPPQRSFALSVASLLSAVQMESKGATAGSVAAQAGRARSLKAARCLACVRHINLNQVLRLTQPSGGALLIEHH
jgi:phosphoribosylcarboxyaminoimidazole (NCAIR) mutase